MTAASTIVLIDPATPASSALARRLKTQGYSVVAATEPAEGARLALSDPPAAVVADLWMPSISGVQLCRLLKAEPATEHVPVILRGPEGPRNRFWAERAGASAYVVKGRMGDLVRALEQKVKESTASDGFFTTLATGEHDIRERIAAHLDAALFESVIASEVRALGTCESFDRLFDLFSQFVSRIIGYRWLAISTQFPARIGLHVNPSARASAEAEARALLQIPLEAMVVCMEDEDAFDDASGPEPIVRPITIGGIVLGSLALAGRFPHEGQDEQDQGIVGVIAREMAGPIRMATLVEESQRLATVDALTGLLNRRAFRADMEVEMYRSARYGDPMALLLLDVDHFKVINDERGHNSGDNVLSALGPLLQRLIRKSDVAARWGGEEFVLTLTSTDEASAEMVAERIRRSIEELEVHDAAGKRTPVTVSIGVAALVGGDTFETLVDRADRAMYCAKSGGRNRVVVAPPDVPEKHERSSRRSRRPAKGNDEQEDHRH